MLHNNIVPVRCPEQWPRLPGSEAGGRTRAWDLYSRNQLVAGQIGPRRGKRANANGSSQRGDDYSIRGRRWYLMNVPDKIVVENIRALDVGGGMEVGWRWDGGMEGWGWRDGGMEGWRGGRVVGWWDAVNAKPSGRRVASHCTACHCMLPFAVMGGSDGLSRLPACLAAARGLCVMGLVGGGGRHPWRVQRPQRPQRPRSHNPIAVNVPHCAGLLLANHSAPAKVVSGLWPTSVWPVARGLNRMGEEKIEGPRAAGLAAASCSPCLPSTRIIVQPCLLASAPLLLLSPLPLCPSLHRSRTSAHLISRPACAPLCLHSQSAFTALKLTTSGQRRGELHLL
jgi:hypothetical protein